MSVLTGVDPVSYLLLLIYFLPNVVSMYIALNYLAMPNYPYLCTGYQTCHLEPFLRVVLGFSGRGFGGRGIGGGGGGTPGGGWGPFSRR